MNQSINQSVNQPIVKSILNLSLKFARCKVLSEYRINGGGDNNWGLDKAQYNNHQGAGIIGEGCLEKLKIVMFLGKHISFIYLSEQ